MYVRRFSICPTVHNSHVNIMLMFVLWDKYKVTVMHPQGHSKLYEAELKKTTWIAVGSNMFQTSWDRGNNRLRKSWNAQKTPVWNWRPFTTSFHLFAHLLNRLIRTLVICLSTKICKLLKVMGQTYHFLSFPVIMS